MIYNLSFLEVETELFPRRFSTPFQQSTSNGMPLFQGHDGRE
jgi:hypothetical protein